MNNESQNKKIYYSHLYFKNKNKELLKFDFYPENLSIFKDKVKK